MLVSLQTTHVLWVYNVYNSWVVWSENCAINNREYSRVHRFPGLVFILYSFPCVQLLLKTETAATLVAVWHFAKLSSTFRFKCSRPPTPSNLLTPHQLKRGPSISSQIQNALYHKILTRKCPTQAGHKSWKMGTPYSKSDLWIVWKGRATLIFFAYYTLLLCHL